MRVFARFCLILPVQNRKRALQEQLPSCRARHDFNHAESQIMPINAWQTAFASVLSRISCKQARHDPEASCGSPDGREGG